MKLRILKRAAAGLFFALLVLGSTTWGQQSAPPTAPKAAATPPDPAAFLRATDEVMADMSKLLGLPQKEPLKRTLRSREEIHAYVIQQMKEDKNPEKRYADERTLEKFGLLPKDFPLESFLVDLLTEQIAGLYDPKAREFYIADWIDPSSQKEVMAHELTHALQDQNYHIDAWRDAAKPNDDAESARDAVLEGSAVASMLDYALHKQGMSLSDLGDMQFSTMLGKLDDSPLLMKAPPFLRDTLLFPYAAGADFSQAVLRARGGWPGFHTVFEKPPVSTQQIMHPKLYLDGVIPDDVTLPDLSSHLPKEWKQLDSNVMGEFGLQEILKEYLSEDRAADLAPIWAGDRYALYERKVPKDGKDTLEDLLVFRIRAGTFAEASRLFGGLSEELEVKYKKRENLLRRPNYFSFDSTDGGVFLRCVGADCVILEGGDRKVFDTLVRALGWTANPAEPATPGPATIKATRTQIQPILPSGSSNELHP